jgi:outer membrane protein OmpA-like peptidoglycan-associated protein
MNTAFQFVTIRKTLVATAIAAALLAGCASTPVAPEGAAEARLKLTRLQSDPALADRAPLAIHEAVAAVQIAEQPEADKALAAHRVYLADRKVETARAEAETRLAEDQRAALVAQRETARLNARTREADTARYQADVARADDAQQKRIATAATDQATAAIAQGQEQQRIASAATDQATAAIAEGQQQRMMADTARDQAAAAQMQNEQQRQDADSARIAAASAAATATATASDAAALAATLAATDAARQAAELQQQIDILQARPTDRGLVLTLGDVLFISGHAELRAGASGNLNKLVSFLNRYPQRSAVIEGYTDSVGTEDYNQGLSQRRADSVRSYLIAQGVASSRLDATGKGESHPVADNASAEGRQQNRRVEVIISNPAVALL